MTNKTETELLQDAIRANGGTCDDLPDTLPATLLKKLIESCGSGGGGGGLPTGGAPYQQLVTDGKGNAEWVPQLCYTEHVTGVVIPETQLTAGEEGFEYTGQLVNQPIVGVNHAVTYNGTVYNCAPWEYSGTIYIGNGSAFGNPDTGEPFVAMFVPPEGVDQLGFTAVFLPLDGAASVTLSVNIDGDVVRTIPYEYIPGEIVIDAVNGEDAVMPDYKDVVAAYRTGKSVFCNLTNGDETYRLQLVQILPDFMEFANVFAELDGDINSFDTPSIQAIFAYVKPDKTFNWTLHVLRQ